MALGVGTRLGNYEITGSLGAGGMGEVYRATDTKLGREVAIKTLPNALANDSGRLARFEREAKLLAALNHAHIAAIYGLDEHEGTQYLAMELVEGETLEEKLKAGPLTVEDALHLALQITEALEAAHEKGVVHRDLKPANIMVTGDGQVKVLDFGLAKAFSSDPSEASPLHSPASSMAMTQQGLILGTAGYMSPEQASGQATDQRADVWAFGVVLYEMLTGLPLFSGQSVPHILAAVLQTEPDWSRLPKHLHPRLKLLLERCLAKKVRNRYHSIADVRIEIENVLSDPQGVLIPQADTRADTAAAVPARSSAARVAAAVVVTGVVATLVGWSLWPAAEPRPLNRFDYVVPRGQAFRNADGLVMALSPDGRRFVYNTEAGLYVRSMGELKARRIPGTEEQLGNPLFSPDGQWVAYVAPAPGGRAGEFERIALSGGAPVVIADGLTSFFGASWGADNTILYGERQGIFRVSANGGKPKLVIPAKDGETFGGPELLPDGDSVLFDIQKSDNPDTAQIVVQSLSTGKRTVLVKGGMHPHYLPTGHLVYGLADGLFAVAFDLKKLSVSGGAVSLVQGLMRSSGFANYAVSRDGTLVYVKEKPTSERHTLVWVDRDGREEPIDAPARNYQYAQLSPDGTRIALDSRDEENDIWIWYLERKTLQRLTFDPGLNRFPVWSPDGRRVAFTRQVGKTEEIYWQAPDGSGNPEPLTKGAPAGGVFPTAFSPDGTTLLYDPISAASPLYILSVSVKAPPGAGKPLLASSSAYELNGTISPDGHWLAYQSNESGQFEVYVRSYPDVNGLRRQISTSGGTRPHWSRDGRELFYFVMNKMTGPVAQRGTGTLEAVTIEAGTTFKAGEPKKLFPGPYLAPNAGRGVYDVSPDGKRFLMIKNAETDAEAAQPHIIVIQNWLEELKRRVPTK